MTKSGRLFSLASSEKNNKKEDRTKKEYFFLLRNFKKNKAEREAKRKQRELERQQRQLATMQEYERARNEVEAFDKYVDMIMSVHKGCGEGESELKHHKHDGQK